MSVFSKYIYIKVYVKQKLANKNGNGFFCSNNYHTIYTNTKYHSTTQHQKNLNYKGAKTKPKTANYYGHYLLMSELLHKLQE